MPDQPMRVRTITIIVKGGNHFDVHEGEGYADHLCWDEMLGCIAELTHPTLSRGRARYFRSPEERDATEKASAARCKATKDRNARIEAERAALPTVELRALHCFVQLHGHRDILLDDDSLFPLESQPADIQEAMRKLAAATSTLKGIS